MVYSMKNPIQKILDESLCELEKKIWCDVISYTWPIDPSIKKSFKDFIEDLRSESESKRICVILTTTWWQAEWAEDMVNILRNNYEQVDFIIPDMAMSAGTILCLSGDNIYMDYDSSLWPIDPQIPWQDGRYIPWSGYLDRINELLQKEKNWEQLTVAELNLVIAADVGKLKFIEQAKNLTVTLLKDWLVNYKFKNWTVHWGAVHPEKKGKPVTIEEKQERAEDIAKKLGEVSVWHTHSRSIGINKLKTELNLEICDIEGYDWKEDLNKYHWILRTVVNLSEVFLHSRKHI